MFFNIAQPTEGQTFSRSSKYFPISVPPVGPPTTYVLTVNDTFTFQFDNRGPNNSQQFEIPAELPAGPVKMVFEIYVPFKRENSNRPPRETVTINAVLQD